MTSDLRMIDLSPCLLSLSFQTCSQNWPRAKGEPQRTFLSLPYVPRVATLTSTPTAEELVKWN